MGHICGACGDAKPFLIVHVFVWVGRYCVIATEICKVVFKFYFSSRAHCRVAILLNQTLAARRSEKVSTVNAIAKKTFRVHIVSHRDRNAATVRVSESCILARARFPCQGDIGCRSA